MSYRKQTKKTGATVNVHKAKDQRGKDLHRSHSKAGKPRREALLVICYLCCRPAPKPQGDDLWVLLETFGQALDHKVIAMTLTRTL